MRQHDHRREARRPATGLSTDGGEGQSLVKGVQMSLKAIALSVKPGGEVGAITVGGQVRTAGKNVISVELDGLVDRIAIAGGVIAEGAGSDGIHVRGDVPGLDAINVHGPVLGSVSGAAK